MGHRMLSLIDALKRALAEVRDEHSAEQCPYRRNPTGAKVECGCWRRDARDAIEWARCMSSEDRMREMGR